MYKIHGAFNCCVNHSPGPELLLVDINGELLTIHLVIVRLF
jgi:hypothetical protein